MAFSFERVASSGNTVSFAEVLAGSGRFNELFAEGMQLVEDAAAYLDGPGRLDARMLPRSLAQACSAESMRLTTRLMQIASWLLVRRAVSNGEMSANDASAERVNLRLSAQLTVSGPAEFSQLPERLQTLTRQSLRLQARILHLDRMLNSRDDPATAPKAGIAQQLDRLRSAFHP